MWINPVLVLVILCVTGEAKLSFLSSYWSSQDTQLLTDFFQGVLKSKTDLSSLHYAVSGLRLLNAKIDDSTNQKICSLAKQVNRKDVEQLSHAVSIAGDLANCPFPPEGVKEAVEAVVKEPELISERILQALTVAERLNIKVGNIAEFDKALTAAIKRDPEPKSLSNALAAAATFDKATGAKYFDSIASLIQQADQVDGKYLQLDGGVSVTATAVYGIAQLALQQGKAPAASKEQLNLVANYLLSKRQVFSERASYSVLRAIGVLTTNKFFTPVTVALESAADATKPLRFRVSNLFGLPIGEVAVQMEKLTNSKDEVIEKAKALSKVAGESTLYELNVADKVTSAGFYTLHLVLERPGERVTGLTYTVKAAQEAVVEGVTVTVTDGTKEPLVQKIAQFAKSPKDLEVESNEKISVQFLVKSKQNGAPIKPHQAFVVLEHVATGHEAVFVATAQADGVHLAEIILAKSAAEFDGHGGKYRMRLVVGDALFRQSIAWIVADAKLSVPAVPIVVEKKSEEVTYEPKPKIEHLFRAPEKRPPTAVSDMFTVLCLAPLLLLFILWLRIGVNLGNIPASVHVLVFHGGLSSSTILSYFYNPHLFRIATRKALFALYFVFWLRLTMFELLKYMSAVAAVTFISGHRLLRLLVERRKAKPE